MLVDEVNIKVKAGNGGNGAVAFRREIYVPAGGPAGGDGGKGGDVVVVADHNIHTLLDFQYQSSYRAENGEDGKGSNRHGKKGADLRLHVPVGTIIRDQKTKGIICDLTDDGQEMILARGGRGGRGNTHFKTAVRQAPGFAKAGKDGQEMQITLELKIMADVGLIGFPNVGKSTFLSIVSDAKPKIANYHFTTIEPNLGYVKSPSGAGYIFADIPGLIKGASEGIGLGHTFLKHIERTKVLLHFIDISGSEDRDPIDDFEQINHELKQFSDRLQSKKQIVVANKIDILGKDPDVSEISNYFKDLHLPFFIISAATKSGIQPLLNYVFEMLPAIEEETLYDADDYITYDDMFVSDEEIIIELIEDGIYQVHSNQLRKLIYSIDFSDLESVQYFQKTLNKSGVIERLREMGIEQDDTVRLGDIEFDFVD